MGQIDLHSHTIASDGTLTPGELIKLAKKQGLKAIAITDHDTVDGIEEAMAVAEEIGGIEVIPGVEVSADYFGEIHILGYLMDIHDSTLQGRLTKLRKIRNRRNHKMIERFQKRGIDLSLEELESEAKGELIGRPHFASLLIKKGFVESHREAFGKYLGDGSLCYVAKEKVHPKDAIEMIKESGGVAVLAHPVFLKAKTRLKLKSLFTELKEMGLTGIEVYHSDHSWKHRELFLGLANDLDLCVTGGSDYHGSHKPHIDLGLGRGNLSIPYDLLDRLREKQSLSLSA